ncbi:hypothetical protein MPSEU_000924800 [Mayamaea pseudoterrestris]|nr:hypothetical protein MPSEU_000924800 [Mayamaea pseudoterrestris]
MDDSTNMEGFTAGGDDNDSIGNQQEEHHGRKQRMHRSLPRVKMILEDESYLSGILNALESSGCSKLSYATVNNSWNDAFQQVYATVASDCHLPQGKNRHHKFKEKIVELWAAMERDVLDASKPDKCMEHALYALGMKQLAEYRSIAKSVDRKRQAAGFSPIMEDGPEHAGLNMDATGTAGNYGFDGNLSSHKKARFNNNGTHHHVQGTTLFATSQQQQPHQATESLLTQMQSTIKRMERVAHHQNGGPPKLPSPLADLHRIICGETLVNDPSNQQLVMPYYTKCLTAFLTLAQEQANHFTTPNLLAGVLEGLEVLMQHDFANSQQDMKQRIQYTYTYVLKAYLKLIDPQVKRTSDTSDSYGNHDGTNGSIDI